MKKSNTLYLVCLLLMFFAKVGFSGTLFTENIRVIKIHPEVVSDTIERVCIQFSRFYRPKLRDLEGERPRVFIDIENISRWDGPHQIAVGGRMILRIRTHLNAKANRLRIVLDLEPSGDYFIDQTYYAAGDIFCISVKLDH